MPNRISASTAAVTKTCHLSWILGVLIFCSAAHGADSESSLFEAIAERLAYMEDVGLYKAQNHVPVEDIEREKIVISTAKALAESHGLNPNTMERFFEAQISAAKTIQYRFAAELQNQGLPTRTIDLQSDIRPALDKLSIDIVSLFARELQSRSKLSEESRERFMSTLDNRLLDDANRGALFDAMLQVRRSP